LALNRSICASFDELIGDMDASQYEDYVLFMIIIGYFTQSLPAFQRKVYHPKGGIEASINLVVFFGS
jgi:type I restriction-modification system DNA methylase subunit